MWRTWFWSVICNTINIYQDWDRSNIRICKRWIFQSSAKPCPFNDVYTVQFNSSLSRPGNNFWVCLSGAQEAEQEARVCNWCAQGLLREAAVNVLVPYKVRAWWGLREKGTCCLGGLRPRWHLSGELREDSFPGRWDGRGLLKGPGQASAKRAVLLGRRLEDHSTKGQ